MFSHSRLSLHGAISHTPALCMFFLIAPSILIGCERKANLTKTSKKPVSESVTRIVIDVGRPQHCLKYFPRAGKLHAKHNDDFVVDAVEPAIVGIRGNKNISYDFHCELVSLMFDPDVSTIKNGRVYSFSLSMNGIPSSLADALSQARQICAAFGIRDNLLMQWHKEEKFKNVLTSTVTQSGKLANGELSITIRSSVEEQRPWRVTCSLSFNPEN